MLGLAAIMAAAIAMPIGARAQGVAYLAKDINARPGGSGRGERTCGLLHRRLSPRRGRGSLQRRRRIYRRRWAGDGRRAGVTVKLRGSNPPLPELPLAEPVALRVQLQLQREQGACWEAGYSSEGIRRSTSRVFTARAD
jgi:hypothetical protein